MDFGSFATNWWSKKWLSSLLAGVRPHDLETAIGYAGRGLVSELNVVDNRVVAVVSGPRGGRHNNYLVFPKFPAENAELFADILKKQPAELMALKNNALNPSIELILSKAGLTLFDSLENIKIECDCKDALPCKYVIATLLKLSHKLNTDPSILFKLHGLDTNDLKECSVEVVKAEVPHENGLFRIKAVSDLKDSYGIDPMPLPEFKFLQWTDYSKILPALLPAFPAFCRAGNFKKTFCDEIERIHNIFNESFSFSAFAEDFRIASAKTSLDPREPLALEHSEGWGWLFDFAVANGNRMRASVSNGMSALCNLDESNYSNWHPTVRFFFLSLKVAFYLVRTGAIYPQVFWLNDDVAQMRWLPAEMLPEILAVVSALDEAAPQNVVLSRNKTLYGQTEHVLSLYLGSLLKFARLTHPRKTIHDNLLGFFFDCKSGKLGASAHEIPRMIQEWFSVYNTLDFKTQIWFVCAEIGDDIAMDVFVQTENDAATRVPLQELFENNDSRLLSVLNVLSSVSENFELLKVYVESKATEPVILRGEELLDFLQVRLPKIQVLGIQVEMPKSLLEIKKPKARIAIRGGNGGLGGFSANDILDFDWEVAIGDEQISAKEFLKLAEAAEGLLKFKSQYVQFSEEDLKLLQERINDKNLDQSKLMQACLTGEYQEDASGVEDAVPITLTPQMKAGIDAWRGETEIDIPEGLQATLRPYQERGFSWLYKNLELGFGCILADDMGLGKTLQVITLLLKLKEMGKLEEGKALVIVPAGLLCNWQVEIKKFAPELAVFAYHGGMRDLLKFNADVLVTTYGTFRRDSEKLKTLQWQIVVIDEAQNIKNFETEQSRLVRSMQAPMKIAMSGTPVENRLMEFWTIMDFCNRGLLPGMAEFHSQYENPIQKENNAEAAEKFRKITAPFMLRRMKTDKSIISDLPDKIIQDEYAELTKSQAMLYRKSLEHFMAELEAAKLTDEDDPHALFKRKGIILQMILALKQICNHPQTFLKRSVFEVAQHAEILNHPRQARTGVEDDELLENQIAKHAIPGSDNPVILGTDRESPQNAEPVVTRLTSKDSGKLRMLMDLLESIQEQGEKTLIFTQFAEMGELLKDAITNELNLKCDFYHGGLSQTQRKKMVDDFQENPENKVLILSLKAGGTGLNLTAASQVIHYDLWWNPAIEAQATDRAFRIGQTKNVQVHRFITKGTFEEKINALLESKRAIANMTVNAGETWLTDLSDKELGEVFRLELGV